jgi:hypothetical protein
LYERDLVIKYDEKKSNKTERVWFRKTC